MNIEKLKQFKRDAGYTNKMIADASGVPLGTVQKIFSGETKAPRYRTLKAIESVLIPASGMDGAVQNTAVTEPPAVIQTQNAVKENDDEVQAAWRPSPGSKGTLADQEKDMLHEMIAGDIIHAIRNHMDENGEEGYLFGPGTPMRIRQQDMGESIEQQSGQNEKAEYVYPDVIFLRDRNGIEKQGIVSPPELVIEIMDSDTRSMEMAKRPDMYSSAGVKEYWMIDKDAKNIMVYAFEIEAFPSMYGFSGKVPIRMIGEDCQINFAQIYSHLGFMF